MKKNIIFTILIGLLIISCNQTRNAEGEPITKSSKGNVKAMAMGFKLLENSCFSCHSPNASLNSRIAPPMIAIKKHYIDKVLH